LVFNSEKDMTVESINAAMIEASNGALKGVLGCTDEPVVSIDMVGNPHSSIVDLGTTQTMGPRMAKILSWYDNEWGFSNRMIELAKKLGELGA
jgi:glyceraldehyde 3-phosphate dehydrogenase